jgi:hypothetical protein
VSATPPTAHPLAPVGPARPARRVSWSFVLVTLASAVVGAIVAVLGVRAIGDGASALDAVKIAILAVLAIWTQTVLHEAGHAVAALARGYRPFAFGVGPLRLERSTGGWRLHVTRSVRGIGGFASLLPPPNAARPRLDDAVYLAGGPLANLIGAGLALALMPTLSPGSTAWLAAGAFAAFGLLIGTVNLIPFTSAGWRSDGRGLLDLVRRPALVAAYRRLQELGVLTMTGVRPRDWPEALVPPLPGPDADRLLRIGAAQLRLSRALDRDEPDAAREAAAVLAEAYPETPDGQRQLIAVALAAHAALVERDADLLDAWRERLDGALFDLTAQRHWLAAESALLRGDREAARAALDACRAALDRIHDDTSRRILVERLDALTAVLAGARGPT